MAIKLKFNDLIDFIDFQSKYNRLCADPKSGCKKEDIDFGFFKNPGHESVVKNADNLKKSEAFKELLSTYDNKVELLNYDNSQNVQQEKPVAGPKPSGPPPQPLNPRSEELSTTSPIDPENKRSAGEIKSDLLNNKNNHDKKQQFLKEFQDASSKSTGLVKPLTPTPTKDKEKSNNTNENSTSNKPKSLIGKLAGKFQEVTDSIKEIGNSIKNIPNELSRNFTKAKQDFKDLIDNIVNEINPKSLLPLSSQDDKGTINKRSSGDIKNDLKANQNNDDKKQQFVKEFQDASSKSIGSKSLPPTPTKDKAPSPGESTTTPSPNVEGTVKTRPTRPTRPLPDKPKLKLDALKPNNTRYSSQFNENTTENNQEAAQNTNQSKSNLASDIGQGVKKGIEVTTGAAKDIGKSVGNKVSELSSEVKKEVKSIGSVLKAGLNNVKDTVSNDISKITSKDKGPKGNSR